MLLDELYITHRSILGNEIADMLSKVAASTPMAVILLPVALSYIKRHFRFHFIKH